MYVWQVGVVSAGDANFRVLTIDEIDDHLTSISERDWLIVFCETLPKSDAMLYYAMIKGQFSTSLFMIWWHVNIVSACVPTLTGDQTRCITRINLLVSTGVQLNKDSSTSNCPTWSFCVCRAENSKSICVKFGNSNEHWRVKNRAPYFVSEAECSRYFCLKFTNLISTRMSNSEHLPSNPSRDDLWTLWTRVFRLKIRAFLQNLHDIHMDRYPMLIIYGGNLICWNWK